MTSTYVRPYGPSGQWKVVRMDSWVGESTGFFGGKSHGATSRNYIAQLVLKKKFQRNLAKRFFDRAFITFYYNLRKLLCQQTAAERFQRVDDRQSKEKVKETLPDKPFYFENLRSLANAAPDWLGQSNNIDTCRSKVCFILRGHIWYITRIFFPVVVVYSGRKDLPSNARAFSLTCFEKALLATI